MKRFTEALGIRARLDLELELDQDPEALRAGDTVSGRLTVRAREDVECDALVVELQWHTHGRVSSTGPWTDDMTLFEGRLEEGSVRSFPFSLSLPSEGPLTYRGEHLNIDWRVRARAEVSRSLDPESVLPLVVTRPVRAESPAATGATSAVGSTLMVARSGPVWGRRLGFVAVAFLLLWTFAGGLPFGLLHRSASPISAVAALVRGEAPPLQTLTALLPIVMVAGAVIVLLAVLLRLAPVRSLIARRRLGEVTFEVAPGQLRPGDEMQARVQFSPRVPVDLLGIEARVEAREKVISGSGTNRRTYHHVAVHQRVDLCEQRRVGSRMPFQSQAPLGLSANAPPSFAWNDQWVSWHVVLTIALRRWPDWTAECEIEVGV